MSRLFLIRHGCPETAWGGADADPGLGAAGREQAEAAARALAGVGPLAIVSSPMRRCLETAAPYVAASGAALVIEPRVSEIRSPEGVEDRARWLQERFPWRTPDAARNWDSLELDLHAWRNAMLSFARGIREDTAVFTHFIGINVITGAALASERTIVCRPDHCAITELSVRDGTLRLVRAGAEMQVDDVR
jgi:broad specificity phosphatase PhoE